MWYIAIIAGLLFGLYQGMLSFWKPFKELAYYYPLAACMSACVGLCWAWMARSSMNPETVYRLGTAFDGGMVITFYLASMSIYGMKFTTVEYFGIGLIVSGMMLLK